MKRSPILIAAAALALALTTAPAFANNDHGKDRSCDDGKGNWHYCFVPNDDPPPNIPLPVYEVVSNVGTVQRGKTISVEANCSEKFYAMSGSFQTDTPMNGVRVPQRVYMTSLRPTFPAGMDQTNSAPIGEKVTVINNSVHVVEVTTFATCMSMTTP